MELHKILIIFAYLRVCKSTEPLEIVSDQKDSGIYYEKIGKSGLYSNEWIIVTYYDLKDLRTEYENIIELTVQIRKICTNLKAFETICNGTIVNLNYLETKIAEKNDIILPKKRVSRSLISLIGKIGKPLFGILNEDDAQEYDRKIQSLSSNQETLLNIIKNQTTLIDLTVNVFNKSRHEITKNFAIVADKIKELKEQMKKAKYKTEIMEAAIQMESIVSLIVLMMMRYQSLQTEILNLLLNSQHGNFQVSLFTPNQIENLFTVIRKELPNTYTLPFNSEVNLPLQLYKLSTTSATVINEKIILEIRFPLPLKETYQLYRLISFPTEINDSLCYIQPSSKYFLIDLNREHYYHLSLEELHQCVKKDDTEYYCKLTSPLLNANLDTTSCEASLIRQEPLKEQCKTQCIDQNYYVTPLSQPNSWLYATKSQLQIDVVCKESIQSYSLKNSGILRLRPNCYIRSKHFILYGQNYKLTENKGHFSPLWNLSTLIKAQAEVSISKNVTNTILKLNENKNEIEKLQKQIQFQKEQENRIKLKGDSHHFHHYTITYLLISFIIIAAVIFYIKRKTPQPKNLPPVELENPNPHLASYEIELPGDKDQNEESGL